jgi:RHS repeat-associated protein
MDNSVSTSWGPPLSYFRAANNRITGPGYQFDGRGNMTAEPIPGGTTIAKRYTYNAENKILTFNTSVNTYDYDGDGRRVKFKDSFNRTTRMVYDATGQLIAEYDAANGSLKKEYVYRGGQLLATIEPGNGVKIGTPDHLGSMREWTDLSGNLIVDGTHDYTPFGTDLYYGEQRDGQRQQFDAYERDIETGLDFAQARYYSNIQGRFTSPDEPLADQIESSPQSWNLYTFARNNPLIFTDPSGRACYYQNDQLIGCDGDKRIKIDGERLIFTPKKSATPLIYDLNKVQAQEEISAQACDCKPIPTAGQFGFALFQLQVFAISTALSMGGSPSLIVAGVEAGAFVNQVRNDSGVALTTEEKPNLTPLHDVDERNLIEIRKMNTDEIIRSLQPGQPESLKARPDGTILNGHHRIKVLQERGVNVNTLPREVIPKVPMVEPRVKPRIK